MNVNVFRTLIMGGMTGLLLLGSDASAKHRPDHPYRYSVADVPGSPAVGTVQTPEFPVASHWYWIMVQVEQAVPPQQMPCMMGVTLGLLDLKDCSSNDPLLRADWTVRDGGRIINSGSVPDRCACKFDNKYIFKIIGSFAGEAGKKYVVEAKFTKDGTPLNVANPHLIVTGVGDE